jgi:hypothetical protein
MTTIPTRQAAQLDREHKERLQRCAELGQVVPIDKPRIRVHYEQMAAELLATKPGSYADFDLALKKAKLESDLIKLQQPRDSGCSDAFRCALLVAVSNLLALDIERIECAQSSSP